MKKRGFTLIEVVIVMALFAILVGSTLWLFVSGLRVWGVGRDRSEIRQLGNSALERMVRDLSQANSFTIAQANQVKFSADVDDDASDETIAFALSNGNLAATVDGTETILALNVDNFALAYLDLNNAAMNFPITGSDRDDIRVVTISLTLKRADETLNLSSSVYARNQ